MRARISLPFASVALPPLSCAGSIRAYITKDTTADADAAGRTNRYPASVYCGIAWYLEGTSEQLGDDLCGVRQLPATLLLGPQSRPLVTRNPGPVRTFGAVFHPQAFHRMTGLDISTLVDGLLPAEEVLPAQWRVLCHRVRSAAWDEQRMELLEEHVKQADRLRNAPASEGSASVRWMRDLRAHAIVEGLGDSVRSLERLARVWAGQSLRRLGWLSRAEDTLVRARLQGERSGHPPRWQDVAQSAGYADQSHLCREARRVTGVSPGELVKLVQGNDDSYWFYRLWS